jgi:hypothetical protein
MTVKPLYAVALMVAAMTAISPEAALGQPEKTREPDHTRLWHRPFSTAAPGISQEIEALIKGPLGGRSVVLYYRKLSSSQWKSQVFRRAAQGGIAVEVPAADMQSPGLEYYIAASFPGGSASSPAKKDIALFASRENPHKVLIYGYTKENLYEKRKAEHQGRLSRVEVQYGYTDFGLNVEEDDNEDNVLDLGNATSRGNVFHEISAAYTYRLLSTLYAIRVEIAGLSQEFSDFRPFQEDRSPGMYLISPSAEFEFHPYLGASALLRFGISEEEFEFGGGTSLRIGRMVGTRLDLGVEGMSHAGWQLFLRFTWDTVPYVPMSLLIARTQWYAAPSLAVADWGAMLVYEAQVKLPAGFGLRGKIGYAARDESTEGGLVAGGGVSLDF